MFWWSTGYLTLFNLNWVAFNVLRNHIRKKHPGVFKKLLLSFRVKLLACFKQIIKTTKTGLRTVQRIKTWKDSCETSPEECGQEKKKNLEYDV